MDMRFPIILIGGMLILFAVVGIVAAIRSMIRAHKRTQADRNRAAKEWYVLTALSVVIMILSWIYNMGWFRFALTLSPLPLAHTCIFVWINFKVASKASSFSTLKKYAALSCITYLLPYLILPDGSDYGEMYFFFGLIKSDAIASVLLYITPLAFASNVAVLVLAFIELRKCKSPANLT